MTPDKTVFTWDNCEAEVSVTPVSAENGIYLYRITVDYPEKRFPERIKLRWFTEFDDIFSTWNPGGRFSHELMPSWRPVDTRSRSAAGAPVFSMMAKGSENRCTFALADAANPVRLTGGMEERSGFMKSQLLLERTCGFIAVPAGLFNHGKNGTFRGRNRGCSLTYIDSFRADPFPAR